MPCSPRQTPKMGSLRASARSIVRERPKSRGQPGPGDSTMSVGCSLSSCRAGGTRGGRWGAVGDGRGGRMSRVGRWCGGR
eukprot:1212573-Prymnesium_polylepis.1